MAAQGRRRQALRQRLQREGRPTRWAAWCSTPGCCPTRPAASAWTGEKFYSTGTLFSDYLTVTATTDHDSVATVVVPADRTGVKLVDDWDGFGQRRTGTGTTIFKTSPSPPTRSSPTRRTTPTRCPSVQYAVAAALHPRGGRRHPGRRRRRRRDAAALARPQLQPRPDRPAHRRPAAATAARRAGQHRVRREGRGARRRRRDRRGHHVRRRSTGRQPRRRPGRPRPSSRSPRSRCTSTPSPRRPRRGCWSSAAPARPAGRRNLDRHWRNIRTITLHNPVAYKAVRDRAEPAARHPVPGQRLLLTTRDFGALTPR